MSGLSLDRILVVLVAIILIVVVNGYFLFTGSDPVFGARAGLRTGSQDDPQAGRRSGGGEA
ncbi:MAG: hypothetical protein LBG44_01200 [Gemmatimonadota bacterium]|jgi:hypothetical protein|nr:hypothetical protein [Gemmatimonadota bacterium]